MSDRIRDFERFLHDKAEQAVNNDMDSARKAAETSGDPNARTDRADQIEQETEGHGQDLHRDVSEEAQKEAEQAAQEQGGEAFIERQVQLGIKKVAQDVNEGKDVLKWAGTNIKVFAGIAAGLAVAAFAGLHAFHFDGFDHPLVSTPGIEKIEIANRQFQSMVETNRILQQQFQIGLMLSKSANDTTFRNLRVLADPKFVPPPPQIDMSPRMAQLPVLVILQNGTEHVEYSRPYQDVIASYDVPSDSRRRIHSEVEKAVNADQGTHVEVHLTGVKVPNKDVNWDNRKGDPGGGWHWEIMHTTKVVPN